MAIRAWSVADVREAEADAMAQMAEGELMARAAHGLAVVVGARISEGDAADLVVLAGPGGNGGDALFAAAELVGADGVASVTAVLTAASAHEAALAAARAAGVEVVSAVTPEGLEAGLAALAGADVVLDGIAGLGGRGDLSDGPAGPDGGEPVAWRLVREIPDVAYVIAVDLPSGADPAGERPVARAVFADETVTFGVPKPVHVLAGADATGLLSVVDIGLSISSEPAAEGLDHDDVAALWPLPLSVDDKYSRGVLGVVAGGEAYTGAAVLTVTGAAEAGAGMVRYVGPPTPTGLVRAAVPEAVHGLPTATARVDAWVVGPGLDPRPAADDAAGLAQVAAARTALDSGLPCVVDAGGLDLLSGPRPGAQGRTLLTPHAGELARLLNRVGPGQAPWDADAVRRSPVAAARLVARALHATVLLKGATTYLVPPDDAPVRAQHDAPAWLATAGAGDVLAGIAGVLLAAGLAPLDAGSLAALLHGAAAHDANPGGPVRASGVAHAIPSTLARMLRRARD